MKLASIETIKEINPHPNADRLELAKVLGWQAIVKKGDFKAGDKCVFVVIDTVLPDSPWSAFLKDGDKPIRLRTVKLRGEYSQGLVLPVSVLPKSTQGWNEGADVGCELGVTKYEKEISLALSGVAKSSFPEYIVSKTDEDNGLSNPEIVERVLREEVQITRKLDGSSMTVIIENGEIQHVCSRRLSLEDSDSNAFWMAAKKLNLKNTGDLIIQGELMGPGIQGNQLGLKEPGIYVYQIKSGDGWLTQAQLQFACSILGCESVPVLVDCVKGATVEEIQALANSDKLRNGKPSEGVVVRPFIPKSFGNGRPMGFKIINQNYGE
jgi:RNA ligase (TIGR02306 family)